MMAELPIRFVTCNQAHQRDQQCYVQNKRPPRCKKFVEFHDRSADQLRFAFRWLSMLTITQAAGDLKSNNQHAVAVTVEAEVFRDGPGVGLAHEVGAGEGTDQHEKRALGQVEVC